MGSFLVSAIALSVNMSRTSVTAKFPSVEAHSQVQFTRHQLPFTSVRFVRRNMLTWDAELFCSSARNRSLLVFGWFVVGDTVLA